jgi:hypothetical protein
LCYPALDDLPVEVSGVELSSGPMANIDLFLIWLTGTGDFATRPVKGKVDLLTDAEKDYLAGYWAEIVARGWDYDGLWKGVRRPTFEAWKSGADDAPDAITSQVPGGFSEDNLAALWRLTRRLYSDNQRFKVLQDEYESMNKAMKVQYNALKEKYKSEKEACKSIVSGLIWLATGLSVMICIKPLLCKFSSRWSFFKLI